MKLKITEHNGALVVSVQGSQQELVIREEGGGFTFQLSKPEEVGAWWEDPLAFEREETYSVMLPVVEPEVDMFTKLANLRREIASANGVPPYMVFHDKALYAMVEAMPQDLTAFGKISGVGQAKLEKYGEMFLSVIKGAAA